MTPNIRIERILCPTDFSAFSARAFRHAIAEARRFQARLKVVYVIPWVPYVGGSPYFPAPQVATPEMRRQVEEDMRRFVVPAIEARVPVETEIREGDPWREIEMVAEELPADLVVMGTHGSGGFERLFLGSVTEKLLRRLPCPVLTVCHEEGRTWDAPGLVRRILCATDLSKSSPDAMAMAFSLARENDAEVTVLNVVESLPEPGEHLYLAVTEVGPLRQELEQQALEALRKAVPDDVWATCKVDVRVTSGRAYKEILRIAAELPADLIVVGTRGHGALREVIFGSTSHHVVREATCPVLTVRPLRSRKALHVESELAVAAGQKK